MDSKIGKLTPPLNFVNAQKLCVRRLLERTLIQTPANNVAVVWTDERNAHVIRTMYSIKVDGFTGSLLKLT